MSLSGPAVNAGISQQHINGKSIAGDGKSEKVRNFCSWVVRKADNCNQSNFFGSKCKHPDHISATKTLRSRSASKIVFHGKELMKKANSYRNDSEIQVKQNKKYEALHGAAIFCIFTAAAAVTSGILAAAGVMSIIGACFTTGLFATSAGLGIADRGVMANLGTGRRKMASKEFREFRGKDGTIPHKDPFMKYLLSPIPKSEGAYDTKAAWAKGDSLMRALTIRQPKAWEINDLNKALEAIPDKIEKMKRSDQPKAREFEEYIKKYVERAKDRAFPQVKKLMLAWKLQVDKGQPDIKIEANKELKDIVQLITKNYTSDDKVALEYFKEEMKTVLEAREEYALSESLSNMIDGELKGNLNN